MIKDRVNGKLNSIYTAPVSRSAIAGAYIATAWIGSVLVCVITLLVTEFYGVTQGMEAYSLTTHLQLTKLKKNMLIRISLEYPSLPL